jgi:multidrug transporter EmrE-like cation transporter
MNFLIIVFVGAVFYTVGDLFFKEWVTHNRTLFLCIGVLVEIVGLVLLANSFKYRNMAVANITMETINSILLVAISWIFFKEQLNFGQMAGIAISLVGLYLLEVS